MIEDGLQDRLANYAGLSALISARVYASHLPQAVTLPAVAYHKMNSVPISVLSEDTDVFDTEFDIGCFANTYDEANAVALQVLTALQRYSGTNATVVILDCMIRGVNNSFETEFEIYETTVSILISHRGL